MAQPIAPSEMRSGNSWIPPTQWSYGKGAAILIPYKGALANVTSNNIWVVKDAGKNGFAAGENSEGVWRGGIQFSPIEGWRDGIKSPAQTEYVQSPPFIGAYESFHESRVTNFHPKDTPVLKYKHDFVYDGPMNFAGDAIGHIQAERQNLANFKGTKEMESLVSVLKSEGHKIKEFEYLGVAPSGRAIYAVRRVNGSIALVAAEDAHEMIAEDARYYGIDPRDLERLIMAEEIAHRARDDIESLEAGADYIGIEIGAKTNVLTSQRKAADGAKGDPKKGKEQRRLQKMARVMEEIVEDAPELYSKDLSYQRNGDRKYSSRSRYAEKRDEQVDDKTEKPEATQEETATADAGN